MDPEEYASFIVRVWRDQSGSEQQGRWCGEIEQIQSGVRWRFCTLAELLTFLQQRALVSSSTLSPSADQAFNADSAVNPT
jgi:hypothetical protein